MERKDNQPANKPLLVLPTPPSAKDPKPLEKLTRENLVEYTEGQLLEHAPRLVPRMFKTMNRHLRDENAKVRQKAIDQVAQLYGFIKASPGMTLNLLQQNNNYNGSDAAGFEKIVRQLERRDRPEGEVIDAEVIEDEE